MENQTKICNITWVTSSEGNIAEYYHARDMLSTNDHSSASIEYYWGIIKDELEHLWDHGIVF